MDGFSSGCVLVLTLLLGIAGADKEWVVAEGTQANTEMRTKQVHATDGKANRPTVDRSLSSMLERVSVTSRHTSRASEHEKAMMFRRQSEQAPDPHLGNSEQTQSRRTIHQLKTADIGSPREIDLADLPPELFEAAVDSTSLIISDLLDKANSIDRSTLDFPQFLLDAPQEIGTPGDELRGTSTIVQLTAHSDMAQLPVYPPFTSEVPSGPASINATLVINDLLRTEILAPTGGSDPLLDLAPPRWRSNIPTRKPVATLLTASAVSAVDGGDRALSQRLLELSDLAENDAELALGLAVSLFEQWDHPDQSEQILNAVLLLTGDIAGSQQLEARVAVIRWFLQRVEEPTLRHRVQLRIGRLYYSSGDYGKAILELPVQIEQKSPNRYQSLAGLYKAVSLIRVRQPEPALPLLEWVATESPILQQRTRAALLLARLRVLYQQPEQARPWLTYVSERSTDPTTRGQARQLLAELDDGASGNH